MSYAAHIHHYYPGAKDIKCVECGSDVDVVGVGCDAGSHLCLLAKRGHHYEEIRHCCGLSLGLSLRNPEYRSETNRLISGVYCKRV
jgi:hypothetical protein